MFSLVQGMYQFMTQRSQFNILVLGNAKSGKTTFTNTLKQLLSSSTHLSNNHQTNNKNNNQKKNLSFQINTSTSTTTTTTTTTNHENMSNPSTTTTSVVDACSPYAPTVGLNVIKFMCDDSNIVMWDLGGQLDLQPIWDDYYADCHAIIYLIDYDSDDMDSIRADVRKIDQLSNHEQLNRVPMMIIFNWKGQERKENGELDRLFTEQTQGIIERMMTRNELFFMKEMNVANGSGGILSSFQYLIQYLKQNARVVNQNDFI